MGAVVPVISAVAGLVGAAATAASALKKPKVSVPQISIPSSDLARIDQATEANRELSESARATIKQAVDSYQQGKLLPQYQAVLDKWWKEAVVATQRRFAAAGLTESTMYDAALLDLNNLYLSNQASLLQKQLSDALSLSGLSREYINSLLTKTDAQIKSSLSEAQSRLEAQRTAMMEAGLRGQALGGLGSFLTELERLRQSQTPQITLSPPAYPVRELQLAFEPVFRYELPQQEGD